jgi:hypothetical protein
MRCKSLLLGGAMVLALSGAAFAHGAPNADQNSQPAAQQSQSAPQPSDTTNQGTSTSQTTKHMMHHAWHHVHRGTRTASLHEPSTPAEKRQTFDLNKQQLQMAQAAANQGSQTAANAQTGMKGQGSMMQGSTMNQNGSQPAGTPSAYTSQQGEAQPGMQPGTYSQPSGAAPGAEPGNAAYSQQQGTSGQSTTGSSGAQTVPYTPQPQNGTAEPGPSYMSAPGANGPVGAPGNPTTPADQNGPTPSQNPPNHPGPSS